MNKFYNSDSLSIILTVLTLLTSFDNVYNSDNFSIILTVSDNLEPEFMTIFVT